MAYKGNTWGYNEAVTTINTNVWGTVNVCDKLIPLLKNSSVDARIVNVCSMLGKLRQVSEGLQKEFTSSSLTVDKLRELLTNFTDGVKNDDYASKGWGKSMYGTSKLGEIAYGKILAREQKDILTLSYCPGWCKTDMGGWEKPPRTAEEGADTGVWLATDESIKKEHSGEFFTNRKACEWMGKAKK